MEYNIGFLKYIHFFIIYIVSWIMLFDDKYHPNIEWVGLALTYITFLVSTYYLTNDIVGSSNNGDAVIYIFVFSIMLITISISIYAFTFYTLYYRFSKVNQHIKLNNADKTNFETFKRLFVSAILLLYILSFLFFTLYKDTNNKYNNFFDIQFADTSFPPLDYFIITIKIIISLALSIISIYMVYLSTDIYNARNTQVIYSSPENEYRIHKNDLGNSSWLFRNLNMNYLLNYKFDVGLPYVENHKISTTY